MCKSSHHAAHLKHTMLCVNDISVKLEEIVKTQGTCLCIWELNTKFGNEVAKIFSTQSLFTNLWGLVAVQTASAILYDVLDFKTLLSKT